MITNPKDNGMVVFLRKRDKYALPINLTYNELKTYPTSCGGCLSMISNILILTWLALHIKDILMYKHTFTSTLTLDVKAGVDPVWNVTTQDILLAS